MIIWDGQEAPLCGSPQTAAKLRQPARSSFAPKNTEVLEASKETFARLAPRLDGPEDERPLSAFQELQGPEKVSDKEVREVPSSPRPRRPPFDPEVAPKTANFDSDWHAAAAAHSTGLVDSEPEEILCALCRDPGTAAHCSTCDARCCWRCLSTCGRCGAVDCEQQAAAHDYWCPG